MLIDNHISYLFTL